MQFFFWRLTSLKPTKVHGSDLSSLLNQFFYEWPGFCAEFEGETPQF